MPPMIKMRQKPIVSSVSESFIIFCVQQYPRATIIDNNIDDQGGPGPFNSVFASQVRNCLNVVRFGLNVLINLAKGGGGLKPPYPLGYVNESNVSKIK